MSDSYSYLHLLLVDHLVLVHLAPDDDQLLIVVSLVAVVLLVKVL